MLPYPTIKTAAELDALPDQAVVVNVNLDEGPLELYDVFQKAWDDRLGHRWGSFGFINQQSTQELVEQYPSGFYVVFDPTQDSDRGGLEAENERLRQALRPRDADHAEDWLYERAEDAAAVGLPEEKALEMVRNGYSSIAADRAVTEDP